MAPDEIKDASAECSSGVQIVFRPPDHLMSHDIVEPVSGHRRPAELFHPLVIAARIEGQLAAQVGQKAGWLRTMGSSRRSA
jgi:hypothetical protein